MDARYIKAVTVLPRQSKVCGRTLLPFCIRHRVVLESISSPFLDAAKGTFTAKDVVIAAKVLSSHDTQEMVKPFTIADRFHILLLNNSRKRMLKAIAIIIGVMNDSCSYPKLWSNEENKGIEKIPWHLSCLTNLVRNGCTLEEAWTMPEGEAIWFSIANAIYNGSKIEVLSTDEEKELEKFDERIAAYKKAHQHN